MVGLVFVDSLQLTWLQQVGIVFNLWWYWSHTLTWRTILIGQTVLLIVFWNCPTSRDVEMLFHSAGQLSHFTWSEFLSEFVFRDYVKLQPPFYTFYVSRFPSFVFHQVLAAAWAVLGGGLMLALYGQPARYLLATPLWALMSTQPSNDLVLFGIVLIALRCSYLGYKTLAAVLYGLTYPVKPLTILCGPMIVFNLGKKSLISVVMWGAYVLWSTRNFFGLKQWDYLLHQLCVR